MKRNLTYREEAVIRLCHHDHWGVSVDDAADLMHVARQTVQRHLRSIRKKAPQLFPILTPRRRALIELYDQGAFELKEHPQRDEPMYVWKRPSREAVAEGLGITVALVAKEVTFLRKKRFLWNRTMKQHDPTQHDRQVKIKF